MADLRILQDVDTGEQFYPYTHAKAVLDEDGNSAIDNLKSDLNQLESNVFEVMVNENITETLTVAGSTRKFIECGFEKGKEYSIKLILNEFEQRTADTDSLIFRTSTEANSSENYTVDTVGVVTDVTDSAYKWTFTATENAKYIYLYFNTKKGTLNVDVNVSSSKISKIDNCEERITEIESGNYGERLVSLENSTKGVESLSYLNEEVDRVALSVQEKAEIDSVVFAMRTDLHYTNSVSEQATIKDNLCKCMRSVADKGIIDFTLEGGDLYDGTTFDNDREIINRSNAYHSGQRCPHLIQIGDHDANQSDTKITAEYFVKATMPYMPQQVVRPTNKQLAKYNAYFYDIPNKASSDVKTRFICIPNANNVTDSNFVPNLFAWLINEVFTNEVKEGWQFIISAHTPIDIDGLVGRYKADGGEADSSKYVRRDNLNLGYLVNAINDATTYSFVNTTSYTVYYDANGVMTTNGNGTPYTFKASGHTATVSADFREWTSKVRLIVSGHNHCDRLGTKVGGVEKDYIVAYTSNSSRLKGPAKTEEWFTTAFGTENALCWWNDTRDEHRVVGTKDEMSFDVYIVNGNGIKRIRFGCGKDVECNY